MQIYTGFPLYIYAIYYQFVLVSSHWDQCSSRTICNVMYSITLRPSALGLNHIHLYKACASNKKVSMLWILAWTFLSLCSWQQFAFCDTNKAGRTRSPRFFANYLRRCLHSLKTVHCVCRAANCTAQIYCYRGGLCSLVTHACKTRLYLLCKNSSHFASQPQIRRPGRFFSIISARRTEPKSKRNRRARISPWPGDRRLLKNLIRTGKTVLIFLRAEQSINYSSRLTGFLCKSGGGSCFSAQIPPAPAEKSR